MTKLLPIAGLVLVTASASCSAAAEPVLGAWVFQLRDSTGQHTDSVQALVTRPVDTARARDPRVIAGTFSSSSPLPLRSQPNGDILDGYLVRPDSMWLRLGQGSDAGEIEIHLRHTSEGWVGQWCQIFYAGGPCGRALAFPPHD